MIFSRIKSHYSSVAKQLSLKGYRPRQGCAITCWCWRPTSIAV